MQKEVKNVNVRLSTIINNTEYLSNIIHISEKIQFQKNLDGKQIICSKSLNMVIVQLAYLIYTCSGLKTNIYISCKPRIIKHPFSLLCRLYLIFFLENQQDLLKKGFEQSFVHFNFSKGQFHINKLLVTHINNVLSFVQGQNLSTGDLNTPANQKLKAFQEYLNKKVCPSLLSDSSFPVCKNLQKTELFQQNSSLLIAFQNSLFYKIRKNKFLINQLKNVRVQLQYCFNLKITQKQFNNYLYVYKKIDDFLLLLIKNKVACVQKSTSKDEYDSSILEVGYLKEKNYQKENVKHLRYCATFSVFQGQLQENKVNNISQNPPDSPSSTSQREKNKYSVQYIYWTSQINLVYVTNIEVNLESIDVIANHCHNVSFRDQYLTLGYFQTQTSQGEGSSKKLLSFTSSYNLKGSGPHSQPLTKILLLLEYLTIFARVYMPMVSKLPAIHGDFDLNAKIAQHIFKMIGDKAERFYKNL